MTTRPVLCCRPFRRRLTVTDICERTGRAPPNPSQSSSQTSPNFVARQIWEEAYTSLASKHALQPLVKAYEEFFHTVLSEEEAFRKVAEEYSTSTDRYSMAQGVVSSAVDFINKIKELVGSLLHASPPASLAWAGVCTVILPILVNHTEQIAAREAGFGYVMSRFTWYTQVLDLLNRDYWKSQHHFATMQHIIRAEIVALYALLIEYQLRAYYTYCRPTLITFSRDLLKLDDWNKMILAIKGSEKRLQEYMDLHFEQHLLDKLHTVSEDAVRKQRMEASLKFKFPDELPYAVYQAYIDSIDAPVAGSGEGVFAHPEFVKWASGDTGAFVLAGIPGTGKSVLSKALLTRLQDWRPTLVCAFFFKDNAKGQNAANLALCRVIDELFKERIELVDSVSPRIERLLPQEVRCNVDLLWSILEQSTEDSEPGSVTIILDGLDECESESAQKLYHKLGRYLAGPAPKLKFFLTTRLVAASRYVFDFPRAVVLRTNEDAHCLDHVSKDIERVVAARFAHFAQSCIRDDPLRHELLGLVRPKEERTYLYVKLLFDCLDLRIRDGLPRVPRGWVDNFKTLPTTVKDAYLKFLHRVQESHRVDVRRMFQMVVASTRPLTVREINIALNIRDCKDGSKFGLGLQSEDDFRHWILDACKCFLDVYDSRVYFIHQTAKEFLLAGDADGEPARPAWLGGFTVQDCHRSLAESCIMYLTLPFRSESRFRDPGEWLDGPESDYHLWDYPDLEFAGYSGQHWQEHFNESRVQGGELDGQSNVMAALRSWRRQLTTTVRWIEPDSRSPRDQKEDLRIMLNSKQELLIVDLATRKPLPRIPRISVYARDVQAQLSRAIRSIVLSRTIRSLTMYRSLPVARLEPSMSVPSSPVPRDWFGIRMFNKDRSYRTLEDAAVARFQLFHGEMFTYVLSNYSEMPVWVYMLSLNASWTVGTLLWNVCIPPGAKWERTGGSGSERTGDLSMSIPRKLNDDDPDVIEDTMVVIACFGEQFGGHGRGGGGMIGVTTPEEWLKNIYVPPVLVEDGSEGKDNNEVQQVPVWLPFIPPPNWQIRHFTIRTVPREVRRSSDESERGGGF
ncbi:hypothetical protein QBC42DRAFT_190347 [Cladorrhinum samala]|uniref:NACHT domain-containing protein n=1 Tax=Cladorrhinum samala TaxID=585594 RepID=A0AAV9HAZ5_9PEZI|nr:hypothetical protein QBC42DRAFT_190347 [Cladorrhinum samala]